MKRYLPIVVAAGLLLLDGLVYGLWTNRWRDSAALQRAVERLDHLPLVVGDWQGEPGTPVSDREASIAGFSGHLVRVYRNRQTGQLINVMLACGPAGPLSVHTPDICYRGAGYEVIKEIVKRTEANTELFQGRFGKPDSLAVNELRVLWTWNADGAWRAPDNPRFAFAGAPALYKLYVIQETTGSDTVSESACSEFLELFLPEVNGRLFPVGRDE